MAARITAGSEIGPGEIEGEQASEFMSPNIFLQRGIRSMGIRAALIYALLAAVIGLALVGCATAPSGSATAPSSSATSQAALLAQAGFTLRTADTPKRLAYINSLPPQKVVQHNYKGKTLYIVCQDPSTKQCYVGDEAEYQRYQDLASQAKISAERRSVSEQRWDPEALQMWADAHGAGR